MSKAPWIFAMALSGWAMHASWPAFAQETASAPVIGTLSRESLPNAMTRPAPADLDDLAEIQQRIVELVPRLKECTVNLQLAGAQGSGVIVSPQGHILTAAHVSGRPGYSVTVITADGKSHRAVTLGRNTAMDASMIKLDGTGTNWPYCALSKEQAAPGDWCLLMGHPGGYLDERGVALRVGRVILRTDWMLQTDCEMVGGDSGGPVFNLHGDVIGINTRIGEGTKLNFHIPIDAYIRDWKRLANGEDFRTHTGAYLGVAGKRGVGTSGLEITQVYPGDPADRAGMKAGDILLTFEGKKVESLQQLIDLVGRELPGKQVTLEVQRAGEVEKIKVRLGMRVK